MGPSSPDSYDEPNDQLMATPKSMPVARSLHSTPRFDHEGAMTVSDTKETLHSQRYFDDEDEDDSDMDMPLETHQNIDQNRITLTDPARKKIKTETADYDAISEDETETNIEEQNAKRMKLLSQNETLEGETVDNKISVPVKMEKHEDDEFEVGEIRNEVSDFGPSSSDGRPYMSDISRADSRQYMSDMSGVDGQGMSTDGQQYSKFIF